ncbi:MAG TPA: ADP-ribosylglycohydrolase family protein [Anaerolineaceae bacterium]|nr:ADP-ribosylglycohydrolase family protein [Anaerolineaceae bacterium]HPN52655.1 ADP-ribosylglycohydrolase family protein [Anaerolineaceae bacterium]
MTIQLPQDYEERVYAGWLGKVIGVRFGGPVEGWTYAQIQHHLGEVEDYLPMPEGVVFQPDDDTAVPMVLLRAVEDDGPQVSAAQMGQTLLNYLGDQHGSLWWGGYGNSTEHTAYLNLKTGIPAPESGSMELNGSTVAEQIGGQIFSDIWGLINPAAPERAAEYAHRASSVTHDRNGIYGGMFVAGLTSAAFAESDPEKLVLAGLQLIPADSEYARVVQAVLAFYRQQPGDWRACYEMIARDFGYHKYPGVVHIIPNAAVVVMGLLYSGGDFSKAIQITNMAGWDTDCNVGNVGAIMGVAVGLKGIPMRWREPINDVFAAASAIGARNLVDIPAAVRLMVNLGRQIAGLEPLPRKARAHFDLPGSTHGFLFKGEQRNILTVRQMPLDEGGGALKVVVRLLKKKQDTFLYQETYYPKARLNSDFYSAGFSPTLYPGQTLRCRVYLPTEVKQQILAGLYVWDQAAGAVHQGQSVVLRPGEWQTLAWRIPALDSACLSQAGLVVRNMSPEVWKGEFWLDDFDWDGQPEFVQDFARAKPEYGAISGWTYLRGFWRPFEGGYHGSGVEVNETYTGDIEWTDLNLRVHLKPLRGGYHLANLRVQGGLRSYAAGLAPDGRLVIMKKEQGQYRELASSALNWTLGEPYELAFSAKGSQLAARVNDACVEVVDLQDPYLHGQIGLTNFAGCHTRYERLYVG